MEISHVGNFLTSDKGPSEQNTRTYSMQQSPSWEANRFSASQEISHILWNPKVH